MTLYEHDLALVQAEGFADFARRVAPEIVAWLRSRPHPVRRVLDVGCGAGISTAALVAAGFETIAIEPSLPLLERARAAAPGARFIHASVYDVELPACDAVLALGEPLGYHAPESDGLAKLVQLFAKVSDALPPGGVFAFDLITTGEPSLANRGGRSGPDWAIVYELHDDPARRLLTREIETFVRAPGSELYRRASEIHHVRLFDPEELSAELSAAGFDVRTSRAYGSAELAPRRLAFLATRRAS